MFWNFATMMDGVAICLFCFLLSFSRENWFCLLLVLCFFLEAGLSAKGLDLL